MSSTADSELPASIILDQLAMDIRSVERTQIRRGLVEAMRAWPGEEQEQWWRWTSETAASLGMEGRAIDLSKAELAEFVRNGAQLVIRDEDSGEWFGVLSARKNKLFVIQPSAAPLPDYVPIKRFLQNFKADSLRVVAFNKHPLAQQFVGQAASPADRLRLLLRPEWSDIWIVILFAFIVGLLSLATPVAIESLVNSVAFGRFLQPVIVLAVILFVFLAFSGALRALQTYTVEIVQRRLFARVAGDLSFRLPRIAGNATDGQYAPELVNRFFDVVLVQKICAQLLLDGVGLILSTLVGMAVLGFYHPWLLGFDVILLACIAFSIIVLGRGAVKSSIKESKTKYYMAAWLEDLARCPTTFRSSGGTDFAMERADLLVHDYLKARRVHFRILIRQIVFALGLQALASTVLLGLGGWLVIKGELSLGQLVAAELIVTVVVAAFAKLGKHVEGFYDLMASVDKLGALFDLPLEDQSGVLLGSDSGPCKVVASNIVTSANSKFAMTVEPRETVALLGPSGSGKTTIASLLYGTKVPSKGSLTIDEVAPRDYRPDVLRQRVALIGDPEVFSGTIDENVHLHRPAVMVNDVHRAIELVGLHRLVIALPEGTETHLTSGGQPLSSNQIRLLSIARVIAGAPGLIVVDGTLDALGDDELDAALEALTGEHRKWTTVILTGRRSLADRLQRTIPMRANRGLAKD